MGLVLAWLGFIILMGISEADASHYLLFCIFMFYVTYICNQILFIKLTPKNFSAFIFLPSIILCWIAYVYNYLLSFNPINRTLVAYVIFFYLYILIYVFWESY